MATYNNVHWLLSHIRNSFISTDDTGMSENVMQNEDIPARLAASARESEIIIYPGLDCDDDSEMDMAHSYDIMMDVSDLGYYRQRSNTAQNLEKLRVARAKASKIKSVKVDDKKLSATNEDFFCKKMVGKLNRDGAEETKKSSLLSQKLLVCPKQSYNKFMDYAQFDGTAQTAIPTRTIKIYLTMLPEKQRNYPLTVSVVATAKILEFIGLICYKCSIMYPELQLKGVKSYGLYIAEADGEVDQDFPALDNREPCSKFCFSHLALMERRNLFSHYHNRESGPFGDHLPRTSMTSEFEGIRDQAISFDENMRISQQQQQSKDLATMLDHNTMMEAPIYKSYKVQMSVVSSLYKIEIQLGISGEKLEIDPVQQKNSKFWSKQKAISHNMSSVACCELTEQKSNRAQFRVIYNPGPKQVALSWSNGGSGPGPDSSGDRPSSLNSSLPAVSFKQYTFEADPKTSREIVDKINNILEVRSSFSRSEYLSQVKDKNSRRNRPKTNS